LKDLDKMNKKIETGMSKLEGKRCANVRCIAKLARFQKTAESRGSCIVINPAISSLCQLDHFMTNSHVGGRLLRVWN
jgi:hypothetical protein